MGKPILNIQKSMVHYGTGFRTVVFFSQQTPLLTAEETAYQLLSCTEDITLAGDLLLFNLSYAYDLASLLQVRGYAPAFYGYGLYADGEEEALRLFLAALSQVILLIPCSSVEQARQSHIELEKSLSFLGYAIEAGCSVTVMRTLYPQNNDSVEDILFLRRLQETHPTLTVSLFPSPGYDEDTLGALQSLLL